MVVTCEVLKLERSRLTRLSHSENIADISRTLAVLSRSMPGMFFRLLQPANMVDIFSTSLVLRYCRPSMEVSLSMRANQVAVDSGRTCANDGSMMTFVTGLLNCSYQ